MKRVEDKSKAPATMQEWIADKKVNQLILKKIADATRLMQRPAMPGRSHERGADETIPAHCNKKPLLSSFFSCEKTT
jgi:hypothetical protein